MDIRRFNPALTSGQATAAALLSVSLFRTSEFFMGALIGGLDEDNR
jgi:hypothetical protein